MRFTVCVLALICLIGFCVEGPSLAYADQNEICIFLDPDGTGYCSNSIYSPMDAYIIVRNLTSSSDISGWELRIAADTGVFVTSVELMGNGLNVGLFPNMVVGLNTPLAPGNSQVILAKLSVFPTVEGGISLEAAESPSVPGATTPVFFWKMDSYLWRPIFFGLRMEMLKYGSQMTAKKPYPNRAYFWKHMKLKTPQA